VDPIPTLASKRRQLLRAALAMFSLAPLHAIAATPDSNAQNLRSTALWQPRAVVPLLEQMRTERRVLVALFSRPDCPYCEALRRDQLIHLAREGDDLGVVVAEFDFTDDTRFSDADPASLFGASPADFARRLNVHLSPTVVFLGQRGELAERLVGYGSPDFYGAYLDDRVQAATRAAGSSTRPRN
jgi:thioredoxin-related protein